MGAARTRNPVDVTLGTTEVVISLLKEVGDPVSRTWLLQKLRESGHTTTRARLNRVLSFCLDIGLVIEGSKGVQWTHTTDPRLVRTLTREKMWQV